MLESQLDASVLEVQELQELVSELQQQEPPTHPDINIDELKTTISNLEESLSMVQGENTNLQDTLRKALEEKGKLAKSAKVKDERNAVTIRKLAGEVQEHQGQVAQLNISLQE